MIYYALYKTRDYSFEVCEFECFMNQSRNKCGCTPWNYPHPEDTITTICDGVGAFCFESAMKAGFTDCYCPENCEHVQYIIDDISMIPIESNKECKRGYLRKNKFRTGHNKQEDAIRG